MALSTRDTILSHSQRLEVAWKQLGKTLPKIREDVAVLRDHTVRAWTRVQDHNRDRDDLETL